MLRWSIRWGSFLEGWELRRQRGIDPPEQYYTRPAFDDPMVGMLHAAFHEVSTERQMGMGMGPIPLSVLRSYVAVEYGALLGEDSCERMIDALRMIDAGYLKLQLDKSDDKAPDPTAGDGDGAAPARVKKMLTNLAPTPNKTRKKR